MAQTAQHHIHPATLMLDIITVSLSTLLTFFLIDGISMHPVIASASVGFIGSFLPGNKYLNATSVHNNIFIGSFAGMCSGSLILGMNEVLTVGLVAGLLRSILDIWFHGVGGRLGSIAFVASIVILGDLTLWQ